MSQNAKKSNRQYTKDYKTEAVKLVRKIGNTKAAIDLDTPKSTLSQWANLAEMGDIDTDAEAPKLQVLQ